MHDVEPKSAFAASDTVVFLAVHPRSAPAPLPAAADEAKPQPSPPVENAYEHADKASYRHLETAAYYRALDAARSAKPGERIATMAMAVHALADEVWSNVRAEAEPAGPPSQIACAAGCGACCHQLVAIAPAEATAIARFVEHHFSAEERARLVERIRALDTATRDKTAIERARLRQPCAFLVNGACSIYAARPLRCRGVYSRDAGHCRWAMLNPDAAADNRAVRADAKPFLAAPAKIMDAALTGLARACRTVGIESESLELTAAARIALAVPEAEQHLATGDPVFAAAVLPVPAPAGEIPLLPPPA
jgi:Putative zinc- or iron-chelating domain